MTLYDQVQQHIPIKFLKYGISGVATLVVYLLLTYLLSRWVGLSTIVSANIAFGTALILNYLLNRLWTYDTQRSLPVTISRYLLLVICGYLLQMVFLYTNTLIFKLPDQVPVFLFAGIWPFFSFFVMKYMVFEEQS